MWTQSHRRNKQNKTKIIQKLKTDFYSCGFLENFIHKIMLFLLNYTVPVGMNQGRKRFRKSKMWHPNPRIRKHSIINQRRKGTTSKTKLVKNYVQQRGTNSN